jgi:broad specificity phosphatase PhoE
MSSLRRVAVAASLALVACAQAPPRPQAPRAATVYVVRHGQALKNVPHDPGLSEDQLDALTPLGRTQAAALGRYLARRGVDAILVSPTHRTHETAAAITSATGVPATETPALASLAGTRTPDGAPATWDWRAAEWAAGRDPRPVDGESLEDGTRRALAEIERHAAPGRTLVVVTHGDIAAGLLGEAAGAPVPERAAKYDMLAGGVAELSLEEGTWRLVSPGQSPP